MTVSVPNVLMVFPRFDGNSFWNLQVVCDIAGARCPSPPLGLITLAALLPTQWNIRLVNRNAEELTEEHLDWADFIMTGGMLPQRGDALRILQMCKARQLPVVIGGPDAMSSPEVYKDAEFLVLGEAEGLIDQFVEAWSAGAKTGVFEGVKFQADVTKSPIPRFDLLNFSHYLYVGVQFSRGCPFNCEFCDIIELYGRVPRTKTNEQMLAELNTLFDMGYRGHVDFVDDNLIGNKKALKRFLPVLCDWQRERGYPFDFSTEASLNLADDSQLLQMMRSANFFVVFMGIESPDTATLISAQKKQNTRRSIAESVHRIYDAGMMVISGFIIGFDTEKASIASEMIECIAATSIPVAMVGLLTALPNTQLTRRLQKEGRLIPLEKTDGDQCNLGLNFITLRPRRDVLADLNAVLVNVYDPKAYFQRLRVMTRMLNRPALRKKLRVRKTVADLGALARLLWALTVKAPKLRGLFWQVLVECLRNNPRNFEHVLAMSAYYLHLGAYAQTLVQGLDDQIQELDACSSSPDHYEERLASA